MRRSRWVRVFAAFAGGLLALTLVEPPHARACPMHDGIVADAPSSAHAHHADADHTSTTPAPADTDGACCTCLGDCVGAAGTTVAVAPPDVSPVAVAQVDEPPAFAAAAPVLRAGLKLPFANGPPSRA